MHGVMLYDFNGKGQSDVPFGNTGNIVETRVNRRIQPIHFGVNYHASPLQFTLVFGSLEPIDRFDMQEIALWLTGHQSYQWMTIDQPDLHHLFFRCLITQLTPISFGWLPVAFEATVVCDCPYAYGFPFEYKKEVRGSDSLLIRNESTVREFIKPELVISPIGGVDTISIRNTDDGGRTFQLSGIPSSVSQITVDNTNGIITANNNINLYGGFNAKFFRLVLGDNHLMITGDCTLTIRGRQLYNVAG